MDIDSDVTGGVLVLTLRDPRIDAAGAVAFKEKVRTTIHGFGGRVVLDMERIEFLDSSGLGALVGVMKMLDGGRKLELAACGAVVRRVLTLTRMDSIFVLHANALEATRPVAALAPSGLGLDAA